MPILLLTFLVHHQDFLFYVVIVFRLVVVVVILLVLQRQVRLLHCVVLVDEHFFGCDTHNNLANLYNCIVLRQPLR